MSDDLTAESIRAIKLKAMALCRQGKSHAEIAEALNLTRDQVSGMVRRAKRKQQPHILSTVSRYGAHGWTDERLTEKWSEYASRRKAERARQRQAAAIDPTAETDRRSNVG